MKTDSFPNVRANVGFGKYSEPNLLTRSLAIHDGMSTAPYFTDPPILMTELLTLADNFYKSLGAASSKDTDEIKAKDQVKKALVKALVTLGNYVTLVADGNLDVIVGARYEPRKQGAPAPPLEKPNNVNAADGINSCEVETRVDAVKGAVAYSHEYMPEPVTGEVSFWRTTNCTSRICVIKNLEKGVNYVFRVGAIGRKGQVTYSNTVTRIAQ